MFSVPHLGTIAALRPNVSLGRQARFGASVAKARHPRGLGGSKPPQVRAAASSAAPAPDDDTSKFALAPYKPTSAVGEMAAYYLQMQPHLFKAAVESELGKLREQQEAEAAAALQAPPTDSESSDLVLSRRMAELRRAERAHVVEDLMYVCILERFQSIGVQLLPQVAPIEESVAALKALTEGVHSREALEMVREHVLSVLGPAAMGYANTVIKMSKLQAAQVFSASIMFGYFLRRVDSRFQLAKGAGVLPESAEDAVARLERLFALVEEEEGGGGSSDPDAAPPTPDGAEAGRGQAPGGDPSTSYGGGNSALVRKRKGALRQYVESFDQETMIATARLVTSEGASLVERQTKALFGDVKALQAQMQEVVGQDAGSMEELMARVQSAVAEDGVETVTITVATQRRAVLEAVAYGCFLRDVESWVDADYALLTPVTAPS